jgi:hypothetical protein
VTLSLPQACAPRSAARSTARLDLLLTTDRTRPWAATCTLRKGADLTVPGAAQQAPRPSNHSPSALTRLSSDAICEGLLGCLREVCPAGVQQCMAARSKRGYIFGAKSLRYISCRKRVPVGPVAARTAVSRSAGRRRSTADRFHSTIAPALSWCGLGDCATRPNIGTCILARGNTALSKITASALRARLTSWR